MTTTSDGAERWYYLHVPPQHDGTTPLPLVLDLHGYGEGAQVHLAMSGLGAFGDEQGFVTVTPEGQGTVALWDIALDSVDLDFVGNLLDEVERTACIDLARVDVTGLSNGAFLTSAIACRWSDRVAAVAPVAGLAGDRRVRRVAARPGDRVPRHGRPVRAPTTAGWVRRSPRCPRPRGPARSPCPTRPARRSPR